MLYIVLFICISVYAFEFSHVCLVTSKCSVCMDIKLILNYFQCAANSPCCNLRDPLINKPKKKHKKHLIFSLFGIYVFFVFINMILVCSESKVDGEPLSITAAMFLQSMFLYSYKLLWNHLVWIVNSFFSYICWMVENYCNVNVI